MIFVSAGMIPLTNHSRNRPNLFLDRYFAMVHKQYEASVLCFVITLAFFPKAVYYIDKINGIFDVLHSIFIRYYRDRSFLNDDPVRKSVGFFVFERF